MAEPPALPAGWRVAGLELLCDGVGGTVWLAGREDGTRAIVKAPSEAARADVAAAADYLRWRGGRGAIRLLATRADLLLLEHAGERRLLDLHGDRGDDAATEVAASVVLELHSPSEAAIPRSLTPLRDHFASLFARAQAERAAGGRGPFREHAAFADDLLGRQRGVRPLHGDIHHENILHGPRGWLAIDPKGLLGDPAFDVANMFHNPAGSPLCPGEARIGSIAEILARALGRDVEDVLSFALAYSGLSASWWLDDGQVAAAEDTLAIGEAIRAVLARETA